MEYRKVISKADAEIVSRLAERVWRGHYTPIIGADQVSFMLQKFQTATAVLEQVARNVRYYTAWKEGEAIAYFAMYPDSESGLFISKFYVAPLWQRQGTGAACMDFIQAFCRNTSLHNLWLTVNRHNSAAIVFYRKQGFQVDSEIVQHIGEGFVMDDYRMIKALT